MVKQKKKYNIKEPIGIANLFASVVSLIALFVLIFLSPSFEIVLTNGFYLILFAINAYFARARILGYIFPKWLDWGMGFIALGTILVSVSAIVSAIS